MPPSSMTLFSPMIQSRQHGRPSLTQMLIYNPRFDQYFHTTDLMADPVIS